jgi:hypothetical protein
MTPAETDAYLAKCRIRDAALAARTPDQRRNDYIEARVEKALEDARDDGRAISYPASYYAPGGLTGYGETIADGAYNEAEKNWNAAVALWNATPATEDGDEKSVAVEAKYGDDLANEMCAMAKECGVVRAGIVGLDDKGLPFEVQK